MEIKRKALGRGLEQLFNAENLDFQELETETIESASASEIVQLKLSDLRRNPYQPRKKFDEEKLKELASSIKENGVFTPIIVKKSIKGYEVVAGERRVKASKMLGLETIPSIIRDFSDDQMMQIALLENLQREDLNAIEEAEAYKAIIDSLQITQEELGKRLGKSRSHITNMLGILKLPTNIQNLVLDNKLSMGHARVLSKLNNVQKINDLASKTVKDELSVRQLEELTSVKVKPDKVKKRELVVSQYTYLEPVLKEKLGTKVVVTNNKIVINFSSVNDLNRILDILKIDLDK